MVPPPALRANLAAMNRRFILTKLIAAKVAPGTEAATGGGCWTRSVQSRRRYFFISSGRK
jgi:hypothetical protein